MQLEEPVLRYAEPGDISGGDFRKAQRLCDDVAQTVHLDVAVAPPRRVAANLPPLELRGHLGEQPPLHLGPDGPVIFDGQDHPEARPPVVVARKLVVEAEHIRTRPEQPAGHPAEVVSEVRLDRRQTQLVEVAPTQVEALDHPVAPWLRTGLLAFQMIVAGTMRCRSGE